MQYPQQNFLREIITFVFNLESSSIEILHRLSFREVKERKCYPHLTGDGREIFDLVSVVEPGSQASCMLAGAAWLLTDEEIFSDCPNKCIFMRTRLKRRRQCACVSCCCGWEDPGRWMEGMWWHRVSGSRAPGRAGGEEEEEEEQACRFTVHLSYIRSCVKQFPVRCWAISFLLLLTTKMSYIFCASLGAFPIIISSST